MEILASNSAVPEAIMRTPQSAKLVPVIMFTVAGGVDDCDIVLGGLKLPESNVNGDSTLALRLQLVHDPSILEGALQNNKH